MCRPGRFSGDKLALHAAYTQTYTRSHTYTDSCINTASQIEQFTGCTHSDLTHSDLWLSLSLSPHTPTLFFPSSDFFSCLFFSVFPQLGKRLHRGGLIGFASWVGWGWFFFVCCCAKDVGAAGLVSWSEISACGRHLTLFSGVVPTWWSHLRRVGGWCLYGEVRVKGETLKT